MGDTAEFEIKYKYAGESELRRANKDLDKYRSNLKNLTKQIGGTSPRTMGKLSGGRADPGVLTSRSNKALKEVMAPVNASAKAKLINPLLRGGNRASPDVLTSKGGKQINPVSLDSLVPKTPKAAPNFLQELASNTTIGGLTRVTGVLFAAKLAADALGAAFNFVKFSVETVVSAVARLGAMLISTVAHFVDFTQRSNLAFGSLVGDEALGKAVFDNTRRMAQSLGLDIEETTDSYRKLLAAQFSVEQADSLIKVTADLKAIGASADEVKHALLAISQIKMKGKLQAEELTRQLANAGVSSELVYQEIEKSLFGKSDKETRKKVLGLQQAGEISSETAIPAIIKAIMRKVGEDKEGDVAKKFADTKLLGMFEQARGMLKNFFIDLSDEIVAPISKAASVIFKTISEISESSAILALRKSLRDTFVAVAEFAETSWPLLVPVIMGTINAISTGFQIMTAFIKANGNQINEKVANIAAGLLTIGTVMFNVTILTFKFVDAIMSALQKLGEFANKAKEVMGPFYEVSRVAGFFLPGGGIANVALSAGEAYNDSQLELQSLKANSGPSDMSKAARPLEGLLGGVGGLKTMIDPTTGQLRMRSIGDITNNITINGTNTDDPDDIGKKVASEVDKIWGRALDGAT